MQMFFSKLIEQVKSVQKNKPNSVSLMLTYYEQCIQYSTMNALSIQENEILTAVFSEHLAPQLLKLDYEKYQEAYEKLRKILIKQGNAANAARESLHLFHLETIETRDISNSNSFNDARKQLMQLLADTNGLIPRERPLNQFFVILNKIIHISLSGYENIAPSFQCNLIAEALQFACIGLSMANKINLTEKSLRFELLIDIAFAHFFTLHMQPADNKKTAFILSSLFLNNNNAERLIMLRRMLNAADTLVLHASIMSQEEPFLQPCRKHRFLVPPLVLFIRIKSFF